MTGPGFGFDHWRLRLRVPLAMASGFVLTLAYAPVDFRWAAFVALVPLVLALRGARGRDGAACGAAFGLAFFGVLCAWLSLVGWIAWAALMVLLVAFSAGAGLVAAWLGRSGAPGRIAGWPVLFTAVEIARSRWPLGGFAWGTLGSSQHSGLPLLPLARITGEFGITLLLVLINVLLAEAIGARTKTSRMAAVTVAVALCIAPAFGPLGAPSETGRADVALVQGNVPRHFFAGLRRGRIGPEDDVILANHVRLSETLSSFPPDLVVWPENSLDRDPFHDSAYYDSLQGVIAKVRRPLLVGAILDASGGRFTNTELLFDAHGNVTGRYDKVHLVPFGEYVPWHWARRLVSALDQIPSDGVPGPGPRILRLPDGTPFGAVICFESSYPALVRAFVRDGAEFIVVGTNNATFERTALARQHLAQSQMRAVEEGRTVLHAAIAGISAVIHPDGTIVQEAGLFIPAILRQNVPLATGLTPYARYGDAIETGLLGGGMLVVLVAMALVVLRVQPRTPAEEEPDEFWAYEAHEPEQQDGDGIAPAVPIEERAPP